MSVKVVSDKSPFHIIFLLCLISSTGRFAMDSYFPSMPAISKSLGVSGNAVELTFTFYLLGFGVSQLFYGPLSDSLGRKRVLVTALLFFLVASTFCSLAPTLTILLIARLLAGLGIGASGALNRAIANDCFTGPNFSKAWAYTTMTLVLVLAMAPMIGGWVQHFFGWRANFTVATFFVLCILLVVIWQLPETHPKSKRVPLGANFLQNYKIIITTPTFVIGTLCYTLAFSGLMCYYQLSSLLFVRGVGLTPLQYSYTNIIIAAAYLGGGLVLNRFVMATGVHLLLKIGIFLILFSGFWLLAWNFHQPAKLVPIILPVSLYVLGARIVIPNALAYAFQQVRHLGGSASGMIGFVQVAGATFISYIISHFNFRSPTPLAWLFISLGVTSITIWHLPQFFPKLGTQQNISE